MRTGWFSGALVLCLTLGLAAAASARAEERVAVLGLRAEDGSVAPAAAITAALRDVASSEPDWHLLQREVGLGEMMAYHRCANPDERCMTRIGLTLAVDRIIYGTVRPSVDGMGLAVTLYAFDCYAASPVASVADVVAVSASAPVLDDAALARWMTDLAVRRQPRVPPSTLASALDSPQIAESERIPERPDGLTPRQVAGWSLIGGSVVAGMVGAAALRTSAQADLDGAPDRATSWEILGGALLGTSAVAITTGVLLLLLPDARTRERDTSRGVHLAPELGPARAALHARIAF